MCVVCVCISHVIVLRAKLYVETTNLATVNIQRKKWLGRVHNSSFNGIFALGRGDAGADVFIFYSWINGILFEEK